MIGGFVSDTGRYLARCHNCWKDSAYPDAVFVHETYLGNAWAQWTVEPLANGKFAFKSDNDRYLARCHRCVHGGAKSDFAFVHSASSAD